ncbi:MAG: hypothetical protein COB85_08675, partial [Bacteroidetes bacterium]
MDGRGSGYDLDSAAPNIQERFHLLEQESQIALNALIADFDAEVKPSERVVSTIDQIHTISNQGIFLFRYVNDSLNYWSDNSVPLYSSFQNSGLLAGLNLLDNGWYFATIEIKNHATFISLILLKSAYNIDNNYLQNSFHSNFNIPDHIDIKREAIPESVQIHSIQKNIAFNLVVNGVASSTNNLGARWWLQLALLIAFLAVFLSILRSGLSRIEKQFGWLVSLFTFLVIILGLRYLSIVFAFPKMFYELTFFGPAHYATSNLFASIGDFFLNSILAFYVVKVI